MDLGSVDWKEGTVGGSVCLSPKNPPPLRSFTFWVPETGTSHTGPIPTSPAGSRRRWPSRCSTGTSLRGRVPAKTHFQFLWCVCSLQISVRAGTCVFVSVWIIEPQLARSHAWIRITDRRPPQSNRVECQVMPRVKRSSGRPTGPWLLVLDNAPSFGEVFKQALRAACAAVSRSDQ